MSTVLAVVFFLSTAYFYRQYARATRRRIELGMMAALLLHSDELRLVRRRQHTAWLKDNKQLVGEELLVGSAFELEGYAAAWLTLGFQARVLTELQAARDPSSEKSGTPQ